MSTGYILILAVLLLGGIIATVGDRLGTRIGKARLSLFNLRPRKTATLVTILTGTIVSGTTLGILFAASEYLRTGVFELDSIQSKLRRSRSELQQARVQQVQVQTELSKAQTDRTSAQKQLGQTRNQLAETDRSLQSAIQERSRAQAERVRTEAELNRIQAQLRAEINQLEVEKQRVINQKDREIRSKELQVKDLETQQGYLTREVQRLELERQGLRQGNVAIQRGQVLASAIVQVANPTLAKQLVDQLLNAANRNAIQLSRPGASGQIIGITTPEVEQLVKRISDGRNYVIRVLSAANYLVGETPIQVVADAIPNQRLLRAGDLVATTTVDASKMSDPQIQERINLLIAAANFRARNLGLLTDSLDIGRIQDVIGFMERLRQYNQSVEIRAVAAEDTYTAGPLRIELIALQNGQVLFRSKSPPPAVTNP
jgi:uncharacterized protein (DUF3084 family)